MDIQTRKKISRSMKGKSNFEGHKHTHATKIQIGISQEGHRNAKDHRWAVDKETGQETRVKGKMLPKGNRWGRSRQFSQWIHAKESIDAIAQLALHDATCRNVETPKVSVASFREFANR